MHVHAHGQDYNVGDYVCFLVHAGELIALAKEDFDSLFDSKNPVDITDEDSQDWAAQGFQEFASIEKVWAREITDHDMQEFFTDGVSLDAHIISFVLVGLESSVP